MEITSRFNRNDFEVWIDHFQYLDIGEQHQSVPSGKSFIRGTFDPEQNAYIIDKIHIDPDMIQTDVKEKLLHEAKLQAHKRDKKLLRKSRVAMPTPKMRIERNQPADDRPMVTTDLQKSVWRVADSLARSLKDPQGATPGDARWTVSGLSHSSWAINHPDIMTEGESPLTLRIKKLPDGRWVAYGQNRLTNLMNTKVLAMKKTPPGGDDWDDIDTFASTTATYFQEQKANILALKQAMTPQSAPGAGYGGGQPQQQGGGEMGGMGGGMGGMGGMMASRRARRRKAVGEIVPAQTAQQGATVGGPETAGQVNQKVYGFVSKAADSANRLTKNIFDPRSQMTRDSMLKNINDMNNLIHGAAVTAQANLGPQAQRLVQGLATASRYLQAAATIIQQAGPQVNRQVLTEVSRNLNWFVGSINNALKPTTTKQSRRASATLDNLRKAQRIARQIHRSCTDEDWYLGVRVVNDRRGIGLGIGAAFEPPRRLKGSLEGIPVVLEGPGARALRARQESQKYRRLARKLAAEIAEELGETVRIAIRGPVTLPLDRSEETLLQEIEKYPAGVPIQNIEDKRLLQSLIQKGYLETYPGGKVRSLGVAASRVAIRGPMTTPLAPSEEALLQEIGHHPAGVFIQDIEDKRLLQSLIQKGYLETYPGGKVRSLGVAASRVAAEAVEELGIDPEEEKEIKHHQRLVKRIYNQIKRNKRLFGSVRYMSRKMGVDFNDLVRVIGQLIVEGKIEMTKKKKFRPLPEPHTPIPGMDGKFASTNSVFGIDRGRSDKRVDQLLSHSNYQLNLNDDVDGTKYMRDIRERPSKIMPDPTSPN